MRDFLMLLLIAGFFALCLAYVWWCDRIIGPDPADLPDESVSPHLLSTAVSVTQTEDDEVSA
jgi:hypothetical protein